MDAGSVMSGLGHIAAGDGEDEDFLRQPQAAALDALKKLCRRQDLAARHARHIGDKALDFLYFLRCEPFFEICHDALRLSAARAFPPRKPLSVQLVGCY